MRRIKTYVTSIDTENPIGFAANKARSVLRELESLYVGRCFMGAYVLNIRQVQKTSHCAISRADSSGRGLINVMFDAETLVVSAGDVIAGIRIVQNAQMLMGIGNLEISESKGPMPPATTNNCLATLTPSDESKVLQPGQMVCITVCDRAHVHLNQQVVVVGAVAKCNPENRVLQVDGKLSPAVAESLMPLVAEIEKELTFRKLEAAGVVFFEKLLHPRKKPPPALTIESSAGGGSYVGFGDGALAPPNTAAKILSAAAEAPASSAGAKAPAPSAVAKAPSAVAKAPSATAPSAAAKAPSAAAKAPSAAAKAPSVTAPSAAAKAPAPAAMRAKSKMRHLPDLVRAAAGGTAQPLDGYWFRPPGYSRSSPVRLCAGREGVPGDLTVIERIDPATAVTSMLHDTLQALRLVRGMVVTYHSQELLTSHQNLWAAMQKAQTE